MIIETDKFKVTFTEINNVNYSLDNNENLQKQLVGSAVGGNFRDYKRFFGAVVQDMEGHFHTDFTELRDIERYNILLKMFEEDKKDAEKFKRALSIFIIHTEPRNLSIRR